MAAEIPDPIDLSIGYPADDTPEYIKAAGITAIQENKTRYTPTNGTFQLRAAIAGKLATENGVHLSPHQVTVTPGITTGILLTYMALLDPGDEVLVPDPYFPPYVDMPNVLGAKSVLVNTFPTFQLTAEAIRPLITERTKAIVVNSPNNPSGAIYPEKELRAIAALAEEKGIVVISDEVYEHFCYDEPHFSIGSIYENTLTLNGFSKAYAMTGWRVGYISGPQNIVDAINELQQYVVFSSSSIGQEAALAALQLPAERLTDSYRAKRNLTRELLADAFKVEGCQGAFYAFVQLPNQISDLLFFDSAVQAGIILLPGRAFSSRTDYIRLAFASDEATLREGVAKVCELAKNYGAAADVPVAAESQGAS